LRLKSRSRSYRYLRLVLHPVIPSHEIINKSYLPCTVEVTRNLKKFYVTPLQPTFLYSLDW
jgi:hypothetical protein